MITNYYKTIRSKSLQTLDDYKPGAWVCVTDPTQDELENITEEFSLELGLLNDALDEDEVPRLETENGIHYLYTRIPVRNKEEQVITVPILFVMGEKFFITISTYEIPRLDQFINGKIEFNTTQRTKLLLQIIDQIVDQYETYLSNVSRQIKAIRNRLRVETIRNQDFVNFVVIEDSLNDFLSALVPTNAILRRLLVGKHIKLYEEDEDLVEDLLLNNEQSIEGCKSSLKSIVNIREAYSTIMSNNLNRGINLLTIVTVFISVPTLVASIYGMNVGLPFSDSSHAFSIIMLISLIIALMLLAIFKRSRLL